MLALVEQASSQRVRQGQRGATLHDWGHCLQWLLPREHLGSRSTVSKRVQQAHEKGVGCLPHWGMICRMKHGHAWCQAQLYQVARNVLVKHSRTPSSGWSHRDFRERESWQIKDGLKLFDHLRDGGYILSHESGQTPWLLWTIEFARSDAVQVSEPSPYKIRSIQVLSLGTLSVRKPEAM